MHVRFVLSVFLMLHGQVVVLLSVSYLNISYRSIYTAVSLFVYIKPCNTYGSLETTVLSIAAENA